MKRTTLKGAEQTNRLLDQSFLAMAEESILLDYLKAEGRHTAANFQLPAYA